MKLREFFGTKRNYVYEAIVRLRLSKEEHKKWKEEAENLICSLISEKTDAEIFPIYARYKIPMYYFIEYVILHNKIKVSEHLVLTMKIAYFDALLEMPSPTNRSGIAHHSLEEIWDDWFPKGFSIQQWDEYRTSM